MEERYGHHMTPAAFRRHGRAVVDWIADYMERVEEFPVLSQVDPGTLRAQLPASPPEQGEPFERILGDVDRLVMPGITHWQSPSFFGYFPANASGPSILGELLSAGLGVQGMLWATSPACTELETHVLDWMVELLGLPAPFLSTGEGGGVIQDSASSATLCALLAARERATAGAATARGVDRPLAVYATDQAHSSVEKAVRIAGLGTDLLRTVPTDAGHGMDPVALRQLVDADLAAGVTPCMVVGTVGTTSSNVIDPLPLIGEVARDLGVWFHVDAAMSGTAAVCAELRWIHDGLELADSYCTNPHKWLFVNFDCDVFYVADRGALVRALSILPEYLRNQATETGSVIDYRDWHVPLGRRFRALKLWFVLRHYGAEGLRHHVREHVALTRELASWIEADPDFELAAPAPLNLVCFRYRSARDPEKANRRLLETLNASGELYLTHTVLDGRFTLRLSIGALATRREHVEAAWECIRATARAGEPDAG
ncbi:MAG: aspartate aminotransferase family protein [Nitriliruptorales bacterium]|nr:aspartate aminotransferase family protein [Nitriliruptorales bacterium]